MFPLHVACKVTSALAFVTAMTSTFTPAWFQTIGQRKLTIGHIQRCQGVSCSYGFNDHTWMTGTSFAFMILSVVLMLLGALLLLLSGGKKWFLAIGSKLSILGGGFSVIGVSLFTGAYIQSVIPPTNSQFGYSYVLAWVAAFLGITAGILAGMVLSSSRDERVVSFAKVDGVEETFLETIPDDNGSEQTKQTEDDEV